MNFESILAKNADFQFKKWESTKNKRTLARATESSNTARKRPVITISREPGCGTNTIVRLLARWFGFDTFGIELVDLIAKKASLSRQMVATLDEKTQTTLEEWLAEDLLGDQLTSATYFRNLRSVVFTIAAHGNAIIVGRGASLILPPEERLAIRLIAPLEERVRHIMQEQKLSEQKALEYIEKIARQRRSFVKKHFNSDIEDPSHYDLVINTSFFKPKAISEIVKTALSSKWPAPKPRT